jgi:hypothetical protein
LKKIWPGLEFRDTFPDVFEIEINRKHRIGVALGTEFQGARQLADLGQNLDLDNSPSFADPGVNIRFKSFLVFVSQ